MLVCKGACGNRQRRACRLMDYRAFRPMAFLEGKTCRRPFPEPGSDAVEKARDILVMGFAGIGVVAQNIGLPGDKRLDPRCMQSDGVKAQIGIEAAFQGIELFLHDPADMGRLQHSI